MDSGNEFIILLSTKFPFSPVCFPSSSFRWPEEYSSTKTCPCIYPSSLCCTFTLILADPRTSHFLMFSLQIYPPFPVASGSQRLFILSVYSQGTILSLSLVVFFPTCLYFVCVCVCVCVSECVRERKSLQQRFFKPEDRWCEQSHRSQRIGCVSTNKSDKPENRWCEHREEPARRCRSETGTIESYTCNLRLIAGAGL